MQPQPQPQQEKEEEEDSSFHSVDSGEDGEGNAETIVSPSGAGACTDGGGGDGGGGGQAVAGGGLPRVAAAAALVPSAESVQVRPALEKPACVR